jgi:beta-N-acetylhexosaminidase
LWSNPAFVPLSRDPYARRRLAALAAAGAVALVAGAAVGAGGDETAERVATAPAATPTPDAPKPPKLTLAQLAGQTILLRFAGTTPPSYVTKVLRRRRVAGVILFRDNLPTPASTKRLTRRLQRAARGRALISTDQEGGPIRNLPWAAPSAPQPALSTETAAAAAARAAGRDLRAAGVNVNLAPVADLSGPGTVMRGRAFPGDAAAVARLSIAAVKGYRGTGVAPTLKHFPGLGAATVNTDDGPATIDLDGAELGADHLPPFKAAIAAGAPAVMMSHARYLALDPDAIASQSHAIVTGLLREKLGFRGVVMTDSLEAKAVVADAGPEVASVRSMRAGVDLILTTGPGSYIRVLRALVAEARRDRAFRARLEEAAGRVTALQSSLTG